MKVYVAHLKSGNCPKGSKEVSRKGFRRCKLRVVSMGSKKRKY